MRFGLSSGEGFNGIIEHLLVLLVWVAVSIVIRIMIYKKLRNDLTAQA